MKNLINALKDQLTGYAGLNYASESGYVASDVTHLVELNRFPFFNLVPGNKRIEKTDNLSFKEMERHIYPVIIEFGTRSMDMDIAIIGDDTRKGILDFWDDIWAGIKSDRSVGDEVKGILPGIEITVNILKMEGDDSHFIAGAETTVEFYDDIPI